MTQRGSVVWVNLGTPIGSEAGSRRPAVIVSNNGMNRAAVRRGQGAVTVVPVTTNTAVIHPFHVLLPAGSGGLTHDSKAQTEQIRAIDVRRIGEVIGHLDADLAAELDHALRLQLSV
jgi:mRNA interferase MazF